MTEMMTMTKPRQTRWMPVLLAAPVVAGMFGVATTWALTTQPVMTTVAPTDTQSQTGDSPVLSVPAGPSSHSSQLSQNEQLIAVTSARLEETKAKIAALHSQTAALSAPATASGSASVTAQTPSSSSSQGSPAPAGSASASVPAPVPAPPVDTTTGAS